MKLPGGIFLLSLALAQVVNNYFMFLTIYVTLKKSPGNKFL